MDRSQGAQVEIDPAQGLPEVSPPKLPRESIEGGKIMSVQTVTPQRPEGSLSKLVLVTVLCVGYATILAALAYPIYMHLFVFD